MAHSSTQSFQALKELIRYAREFRPRIILASCYSILNKLFDLAPEILIGIAVDVVVSQENSFIAALGLINPWHQIIALGVLTFFVWAGESIFEYAYLVLWRNLAQQIQHKFRLDAYSHVQDLDISYFEDKSSGGLVAVLNDDVNQLERFLNGGANNLIQVVTAVVGVGSVFFIISPLIALLAFTPIPIIIWGAFAFQKKAAPLYDQVREKVGSLSARLTNNILGIATIKSFTAQKRELETLRVLSDDYCIANRDAIKISSAFIPIIRMAILMGFLVTLMLGGKLALDGELNIGLYTILVFLTQRLLWPLTGLAETIDLFERSMASVRRIMELIKTPITIRSGHVDASKQVKQGEIVFDQVNFAYDDGNNVLQDIDLTCYAGKTTALVGQTGSGKSTLLKLMLRFYQATSGQIILDNTKLDDYELQSLRQEIGLVSQDVFLFHGTVKENIKYAKPDANDEEITQAAITAEAHEFIEQLPQGYNTIIGERGQKLSGGQRQRLSIARVILKNPPIMLLDEATSAVDNETEAAIQRSLKKIAKNRTMIVVAHRLSTIVQADQIIVLDGGKIKEVGTHQELINRQGIYASLWQVQTGGMN